MTNPLRPAAYIRAASDAGRYSVTAAARAQGWPAPRVYADQDTDGGGPALDKLIGAIAAGRHDGLLLGVAAGPVPLMRLLLHCTKNGVTVSFAPPPLEQLDTVTVAAQTDHSAAPGTRNREAWDVLARARLEALTKLFPAWSIWLGPAGWHARRSSGGFLQGYQPGAPAFHVSADSALDLAAQLCWQQAADEHAPDGCQSGIPVARPAKRLEPRCSMQDDERWLHSRVAGTTGPSGSPAWLTAG